MDYGKCYSFWNHLTETEREAVEMSCYCETYKKGQLMVRSEGMCKGLMTVLTGQLRVYILSEEGREVTLFRVNDGEVCVLSASCLMESIDFEVVIEAAADTEVLILPSVCLNQILKKNPQVELYLYKTATEKFSEVMWTMQQILFRKIDQRVAAFLWDEMIQNESTVLLLTHDEIARNIGSAREVVTKVLRYLAAQSVVELGRGKVTILDKEKLKKYL